MTHHKDLPKEIEKMVDEEETPTTPRSNSSNSNHFEDQSEEMVDTAEPPATPHSIPFPSNQPNDHQELDDVIIDIETILMDKEEGLLSSRCCIYRVPHEIRKLKIDAYTPKAISIGPFHYGNTRLQNMERHKRIFFKRFIQGAMTSLDDLVSFVKMSEPKIRECYSENIKLNRKELVKVILVDAGFIIELFQRFNNEGWLSDDAKLSKPWLVDIVRLDLLLLENQLPFFFLEELFNRAFPPQLCDDIPSFLDLTFDFFSYYNTQKLESNNNISIKHFTDLLRIFNLPGRKLRRKSFGEAGNHVLSYSTTELLESGVRIKANTSKCILDLKFSGNVLEIPQILVEDRTEALFRNMIALEQCHYPSQSHITDYALVFDCLINTSKDVDVLVHKGIIRNYVADSNNVAKVFNGLWKNIIQMNFNSDYLEICKSLNAFHRNPCNKMKATLRRDYCKTPWQMAASIAGIFLIILTLIQTIFSII